MSDDTTTSLSNQEQQLVRGLQVIGDETRYKIFKLLQSNEEFCVSSIASQLGVSVSAASQHFRLFEAAGLVYKKRYGQKICYRLKDDDLLVGTLLMLGDAT